MPIYAKRPLQTLMMPVSVSRPKRKSRGEVYPELNGGGLAPPEKENGAPATKKKKREDGAEKPPTKKQKKSAQAPIQNDDGFIFRTRSTTRSSKAVETVQSTQTVPSSSSQAPPAPSPPKRKAPRKRAIIPSSPVEEPKKAKLMEGKEKKAPPPTIADEEENGEEREEVKVGKKKKKGKRSEKVPAPPISSRTGGGGADATKVVLAVSDTPIIRRNQQLRKGQGNRRSSVGMRGRRASSLMDTGVIAEPHAEIAPEDFYKHIHDDLLEPQRMKQLLSWCGSRALTPAGPNDKDFNARTISRIIEEELLADILSNAELSSWFNRDDSASSNLVKKPNPRNADSLVKIEECQTQLKRLGEEKATWHALLKSASGLSLDPAINLFDTSLYLPAESSFAASLSQSADLLGNAKRLVKQHASEIEFQVDQIVDGIHRLQQYGESADRLGGRVLEAAEGVLAEREREVMVSVGTDGLPLKEVLRSLSRLDR